MSDDAARAIERRYAATHDPADLVAVLSARLRSGSLSMERVELAAYLGHEAARQIAPVPLGPQEWTGPRGLNPETLSTVEWSRLLSRYGLEAMVRAGLAVARAGLVGREDCPVCAGEGAVPPDEPSRMCGLCGGSGGLEVLLRLLAVAEAFALCPCLDHAERCRAATDYRPRPEWPLLPVALGGSFGEEQVEADYFAAGITDGARALGEAVVRSSIAAQVTPWALGLSEPLHESQSADH